MPEGNASFYTKNVPSCLLRAHRGERALGVLGSEHSAFVDLFLRDAVTTFLAAANVGDDLLDRVKAEAVMKKEVLSKTV